MSTADDREAIRSGRKKDKFYILKDKMLPEHRRETNMQLQGH